MDSVPTTVSDGTEYVPHWAKKIPSYVAPKAKQASVAAWKSSRKAKRLGTARAHEVAMRKHDHALNRHSRTIELHHSGYHDDDFTKNHVRAHQKAFDRHLNAYEHHYKQWKKLGATNEAKAEEPKHYDLNVEVHSHPTGKLKRTFRAGPHESEAHAHKAAHAFYAKQGIKVKVQGVATVKIGGDEESIRNAAERFLDREELLDSIVKNVLEGSLRSIVGTLTRATGAVTVYLDGSLVLGPFCD